MPEENRDKDFGTGSFEDFVDFFDSLLHSIVPEVGYTLECEQDRNGIYVDIHLDDPSKMALVIGSKAVNINILQMWSRAQQIYPQDRYVFIRLHGEEDEPQEFLDRNIRKKDFDYKVIRESQIRDEETREKHFG